MIRTQVYVTTQEKNELLQMTKQTGLSQSELIRKAIDFFCQSNKENFINRVQLLRTAKGLWENKDHTDFNFIRKTMDRYR